MRKAWLLTKRQPMKTTWWSSQMHRSVMQLTTCDEVMKNQASWGKKKLRWCRAQLDTGLLTNCDLCCKTCYTSEELSFCYNLTAKCKLPLLTWVQRSVLVRTPKAHAPCLPARITTHVLGQSDRHVPSFKIRVPEHSWLCGPRDPVLL